jgi:hypothetical protein
MMGGYRSHLTGVIMPHPPDPRGSLKSFFADDMRCPFPATAVRVVPDGRTFEVCLDLGHAYTPEAAQNIARAFAEILTEAFANDGVTWLDGRPFVVPVVS